MPRIGALANRPDAPRPADGVRNVHLGTKASHAPLLRGAISLGRLVDHLPSLGCRTDLMHVDVSLHQCERMNGELAHNQNVQRILVLGERLRDETVIGRKLVVIRVCFTTISRAYARSRKSFHIIHRLMKTDARPESRPFFHRPATGHCWFRPSKSTRRTDGTRTNGNNDSAVPFAVGKRHRWPAASSARPASP